MSPILFYAFYIDLTIEPNPYSKESWRVRGKVAALLHTINPKYLAGKWSG